jgi:hypothetical protein
VPLICLDANSPFLINELRRFVIKAPLLRGFVFLVVRLAAVALHAAFDPLTRWQREEKEQNGEPIDARYGTGE